jgi:GT2 family glycosyltransferase/glycosyltransferase involved in cell wall biosynthesis
MRIGFATERMLTGFGVDLCVDRLATGLLQRGHDVTVYCSMVDQVHLTRPYQLRRTPVKSTKFFPLQDREGRSWAHVFDRDGLDVVEIHTFPFFGTVQYLQTPVVAVDHGVCSTMGMPFWLRADFAYLRWTLYYRDLPRATRLVTISDFLRRQMPRKLARCAAVVPWGSEHYWRPVETDEALSYRRGHGIADDQVLALYVGRLNHKGQPYKGIAELLEHHRALREEGLSVALLCIGYGSEQDARAIAAAGGTAVLCAPSGEMAVAYRAADLFVTCSRWEGFGLPLLEAQRFGRPAVAYAIGAHPEVAQAGETALLVQSPQQFREAWRALVLDPQRRQAMGEAAARHAACYSWDRAIEAHEKILAEAAAARLHSQMVSRTVQHHEEGPSLVTTIVLTYEPEPEHLAACLDSIRSSHYPAIEVLVLDNGSSNGVAERLVAERPGIRFVQIGRNSGFSAGINRGVGEARGEFVFLLNPDARVEPETVGLLVDAARRHPTAIGFAPKMVFAHDPQVIDAIGTAIDPMGAAFNRGIGQPDVGQYDVEELVMGCCFGAALLRREAFDSSRVGPLDEAYFMYYEDVDWCFRATIQGEDFWSVPQARVHHIHSATTRAHAYGFKYRLIQRNLLFTVFKNFEKRRTVRIFAARSRWHLANVLRGPYRTESLRVLWEGWTGVFRYWATRTLQQKRRTRADVDAFKLSYGELTFFDAVGYSPIPSWDALISVLRRLYVVTGEARWGRALDYLEVALGTPLRFRPREVEQRLCAMIGLLPDPLTRLFDALAQQPGMLSTTPLAPVVSDPQTAAHVG